MDPAAVRATVREHVPALAATMVVRLGGHDIESWLVDDAVVFQFPTSAAAAARLAQQVALLALVAEAVPFAVPAHRYAIASGPQGLPVWGHPALGGPIARAESRDRAATLALAARLGAAVTAIAAIPVVRVLALGLPLRATPMANLAAWAFELAARAAAIRSHGPAGLADRLASMVAALRIPPPHTGPLVLAHSGISQQVVHTAPLGLAGWDDAHIADPALDFAGIRFAFGAGALQAALPDPGQGALAERAELIARCHAVAIAVDPKTPAPARAWALDRIEQE